jgi:hypothetical protein
MAKKSKKKAKKSPKPAAKKAATKAAKKAVVKPQAKTGQKPAGKPAKKAAGKPAKLPSGPTPVTTGGGPSPMEIGADLVTLFNAGKWAEIEAKWHSPKIQSIEGVGVSMAWHGAAGVRAKSEGWVADNTIHGATAEGPYVGATGFTVKFVMDVETKSTGKRQQMVEVGVYTVEQGAIVREEFMYFVPATPARA